VPVVQVASATGVPKYSAEGPVRSPAEQPIAKSLETCSWSCKSMLTVQRDQNWISPSFKGRPEIGHNEL
jgi:hypothetical protein